jgi:hypothetical protein
MADLRAIACATVVALAAVAPAAHAAGWQRIGVITAVNSQQDTVMHGLASDRTGALTALYRGLDLDDEFGPVQFRDRQFGGPIGKVATFPLFVSEVRLAVSPAGRQLLAYFVKRDDGSYALEALSRRRAGRAWSAPDVIATGIAEPRDLQLAIASSGEATALWQDGERVAAAGRSAGADRFEAAVAIGTVSTRGAALGMDTAGNSLVAWADSGDGFERALRRPAGGAFGGVQALQIEGRQAAEGMAPELAVTPAGDAALAWYDKREGDSARHLGVAAALGTTAEGFGAPRSLDDGPVQSIDSALDDRLTAVTWNSDPGSRGRVVGAFTGTGQPVETLAERVLSPRKSFSGYGAPAACCWSRAARAARTWPGGRARTGSAWRVRACGAAVSASRRASARAGSTCSTSWRRAATRWYSPTAAGPTTCPRTASGHARSSRSIAVATCSRDETPSLAKIRATWFSTVFSLLASSHSVLPHQSSAVTLPT